MANQIAKNMSLDDKEDLDNMDMQEMISHVTKNVLGMMNNGELNAGGGGGNPFAAFAQMFPQQQTEPSQQMQNNKKAVVTFEEQETDEADETDCIFAKTKDICFDLNVDLEDFYTGKRKKLNVKRKRMIEVDGKQTIIEEKKKLVIPIEKGMKDEQQIRFEGEADQIPGYKPGDIIITLIENEHPLFQRDCDNLIMNKNINLYQNYDYTFDIKHLDGTVYRVNNNPNEGLHVNDSIRKIPGLGMPIYKSQNTFGDLFFRFNLVIPKTLHQSNLELLKQMFKDDPLFVENKLNTTFDRMLMLENVSETDLEDLEELYSDTESESEESETESESEESETEESEISETSEELSDSDSSSSEEEVVVSKKKRSLKSR